MRFCLFRLFPSLAKEAFVSGDAHLSPVATQRGTPHFRISVRVHGRCAIQSIGSLVTSSVQQQYPRDSRAI